MFLAIPAAQAQLPDLLFQSDEILNVRIVAPISTLVSERPVEEELPATFHYTDSSGSSVDFDINIRARGRLRRQEEVCSFPPIRLNFKKSQTRGTLFEHQDKLKLVAHCQPESAYENGLLREYAAYQILNVITEASFKTRLLRVTYVDSEGRKRDDVRYAFVIEHRDRLAKRIDKAVLKIGTTSQENLEPEYTSSISLFHYLIGNTDFSPVVGPDADMCCHNHVLFGNDNQPIWSIPYDFDQAGLVDTPYSKANPRFKLRSVRQRLFRGRCIHNDYIEASLESFREHREEILNVLVRIDSATNVSMNRQKNYVERFYKAVSSERRIQSDLVRKCI